MKILLPYWIQYEIEQISAEFKTSMFFEPNFEQIEQISAEFKTSMFFETNFGIILLYAHIKKHVFLFFK